MDGWLGPALFGGPAMIEQALVELLRPLIREEVQRALLRARDEWRWASVRQAAERLDMSEGAVRKRAMRNQLPYRKLDGRLYIDMKAVDTRLRGSIP